MEKSRKRRVINWVVLGVLLTVLVLVASVQKVQTIRLPGLTGVGFVLRMNCSGGVAYWATTKSVKLEIHSNQAANGGRFHFSIEAGGRNRVDFTHSAPEK